jgi:transposase
MEEVMPYSPELIAQIRRLHFYEHYSIHAVSQVVELHRDTVKRILYGDDTPEKSSGRICILDPYGDVVKNHLERYPSIRATTLFRILKDKGFLGSVSSLRRYLRPMRKKKSESFKPMTVFQGQQAQVDWAHFGSIPVKNGERKLYLFIMVLSWSRAIFARFTYDQKTDSFLRMHEEAFKFFDGSPREILYDNLKSAVLERFKDKIKFNPQLVEFSGFYGFEPRACRPYRGNEKGRVERAIRFVREDFAVIAEFTDLGSINAQLAQWLASVANQKKWPDNSDFVVMEQLEKERQYLLKLQSRSITPRESLPIRSSKCGLIRFDLNDYSIPWQYVRDPLTVEADDFKISVFYQSKLIAEHPRSWNRAERILDAAHWDNRPEFSHQIVDQLITEFPQLEEFYRTLVDRGESLSSIKKQFIELYNIYRGPNFKQALRIAHKREMFHPSQVSKILVGLEKQQGEPAPAAIKLRKDLSELNVKSHDLETYDLF